jgi:hypothetical protein
MTTRFFDPRFGHRGILPSPLPYLPSHRGRLVVNAHLWQEEDQLKGTWQRDSFFPRFGHYGIFPRLLQYLSNRGRLVVDVHLWKEEEDDQLKGTWQ